MKANKLFPYILSAVALASVVSIVQIKKDLRKEKKSNRKYSQILSYMKENPQLELGKISLPQELQVVPLQDSRDVVLNHKSVHIRGIDAPYNCSLIHKKEGEGYWIFFRYDVISQATTHPFTSHIGCAELDKNFDQTSREAFKLDLKSDFTEDPRVFEAGNSLYVMYNATIDDTYYGRRIMHLAEIDKKTFKTLSVSYMDPQFQNIEKNWTPFEYISPKGEVKILAEYFLDPHVLMDIKDPSTSNNFSFLKFKTPAFKNIPWASHLWGAPRGGTPPKIVDGEYLGFFHSSFKDKYGVIWYLMGAYTFEASPPFRFTGISNCPILFEGIYDSPLDNSANPLVRCIFPSGFVVSKENGRDVIHVSCGENDSRMKIVSFDKELLLKSLKRI